MIINNIKWRMSMLLCVIIFLGIIFNVLGQIFGGNDKWGE